MRRKRGKLLGGEPPRRGGRWARQRPSNARKQDQALGLLLMLALGLFTLGVVGGFAWAADRQIRGGILRQQTEAERRPDWVDLERLPEYVPQAFVAVVDPGFLSEGALRTGESGTTVARELVRQVHLLPEGLSGEARELVMGPVLEQRTTKRELLELFLNRVELGRDRGYPIYGVQRAAREYFDKNAADLTLSEAATLAGLLLPPRIPDPERAVGAVGARRNEVLEVLLEGELIGPEAYRRARAEPLGFQPGLDEVPMSRPPDWMRGPEVIRLPEELRLNPDSIPPDSLPPGA